jgi:hypothetical protein
MKTLEDADAYKRLALEVVTTALSDYAYLTAAPSFTERVAAVLWVENENLGALSLATCCEVLGISSRTVHRTAKELLEKGDFLGISNHSRKVKHAEST